MKSPLKLRLALAGSVLVIAGTALWFYTRSTPQSAPPAVAHASEPAVTPAPEQPAPPEKPAESAPEPTPATAFTSIPEPIAATAPVAPPAAPETTLVTPVENIPPEPAVAVADETLARDEVAATRRMYAAHAPLREPEVADPDSETNRRILQTMVEKALSRAAADGQPARTSH